MKATGVIRRVDELGRIVIPKEIRRSLRIRDGEALEIFVDGEMIALKKYSNMSNLSDLANKIVDILDDSLHKNVLITDRDSFIAISKDIKKDFYNHHISSYLEKIIARDDVVFETFSHSIEFINGRIDHFSYKIQPVHFNGEVIGLIIVFSDESITSMDDQIISFLAQFLEKSIEE